jgi:hypothetical protein
MDLSLDYIFGLPMTAPGNSGILVVCDRFSKGAHFIPFTETVTAAQTARLLLNNVIRNHAVSRSIVSNFWKTLFGLLGTNLKMSNAYHPQADGQTEQTNQLEQLLRSTLKEYDNWDQHLATVQLAYNTAVSSTTGQSPYEVTFGRSPTTPASLAISTNLLALQGLQNSLG